MSLSPASTPVAFVNVAERDRAVLPDMRSVRPAPFEKRGHAADLRGIERGNTPEEWFGEPLLIEYVIGMAQGDQGTIGSPEPQ